MKLISWNVNGLRACIQKGFLDFFNESNADFFCLQETKLQEGQITLDLPGYQQYWCCAEKKGYSGTAIFTKHAPLSVRYGLGVPALDTEGRLITLEYPEFFLVTCYTPNAQRELARIDHRMHWEECFRNYMTELDRQKPVILCGDLNVAHQEIDLKNPGPNRGSAGFSNQERAAFTALLDSGFTDTFRYLNPTATGCYTWWSYMFNARKNNAGWRIDYFLTSDRLKNAVYRAPIYADIPGSDHCPVGLELDIPCNGSIWPTEATGTASAVIQSAPAVKKALLGGSAFLLFILGFGAGLLASSLLPDEQTQPLLSYPGAVIFPGSFDSGTGYRIIGAEEAAEMLTLALVQHIAASPDLQELASQYVSVNGITISSAPLTQEIYAQYAANDPALAELETRADAAEMIHAQILLTSSITRQNLVLVMLQTLDIFHPDSIPITADAAAEMTTAALVEHIAGIPVLQALANEYTDVSGSSIRADELPLSIYYAYRADYPALAELQARADAKETLRSYITKETLSAPGTQVLYLLCTLNIYPKTSTPTQTPVPRCPIGSRRSN